ncbi:G protein-coupled receptor rhodopsin-like [Trinorchestia longiramus]|nr:G protein-coupled receptor rhodopsin-like [Trinorchestia longiramus]
MQTSNISLVEEEHNCSAVLHAEYGPNNNGWSNGTFSNTSSGFDYFDEFPNINCTNFERWRTDNSCDITDQLCVCTRQLYLHTCLALFSGDQLEYYTVLYRVIGTVFQGVILVVGVLGNVLVVIVVSRNKNMSSPTNCYLVSLAVADCIVLLAAVPQEILGYYLALGQWVHGQVGCACLVFLQHLGINASSLSLTAFTIERYIAICHPMKAQSMCTVERAKRITRVVWVFAICYCGPWLFLTEVISFTPAPDFDAQECTYKLSRDQYLYYYFLDLIVFYVVPLLLSCVVYTLIARILFKSSIRGKSSTTSIETHKIDQKRPNAARIQKGNTTISAGRRFKDTYGNDVVNKKTCRRWFPRFKKDDFSLKDELRKGCSKGLNSEELQAVIDETPTSTTRELSKQFRPKYVGQESTACLRYQPTDSPSSVSCCPGGKDDIEGTVLQDSTGQCKILQDSQDALGCCRTVQKAAGCYRIVQDAPGCCRTVRTLQGAAGQSGRSRVLQDSQDASGCCRTV